MFEITVVREPNLILGVQVKRDRAARRVKLHQTTYIKTALKDFSFENCRGRSTPMEPGTSKAILKRIQEVKGQGPQGCETELKSKIGKLIFLKTRPDVAFAVGFMARFGMSAGPAEVARVNHILHYLKSNPDRGLLLDANGGVELMFFSDSDLAGDPETTKSTSAIMGFAGHNNLIYYRSFLQKKMASSTFMGEAFAAHEAIKVAEHYIGMYDDLGLQVNLPIKLHVDSANVYNLRKGLSNRSGSTHFRIAQAYIVEKVQDGIVELVLIPTTKNPADLLTKALERQAFEKHTLYSMRE